MKIWTTVFHDHPRSVGESYGQHLLTACTFGIRFVALGGACFVHALIPSLFVRTASKEIERLHHQMVTHRNRTGSRKSSAATSFNSRTD